MAASWLHLYLVTTFPNEQVNPDIPLGGWRMLNMQLAPFYWPAPLMMLDDSNDELNHRLTVRRSVSGELATSQHSIGHNHWRYVTNLSSH